LLLLLRMLRLGRLLLGMLLLGLLLLVRRVHGRIRLADTNTLQVNESNCPRLNVCRVGSATVTRDEDEPCIGQQHTVRRSRAARRQEVLTRHLQVLYHRSTIIM
jgi:hypothetical protein